MYRVWCTGREKQPHRGAGHRDDVATDVGRRTVTSVQPGGTVQPECGPQRVIESSDVQSRQHRDVSVKQHYNVEFAGQPEQWETTAERQRRYLITHSLRTLTTVRLTNSKPACFVMKIYSSPHYHCPLSPVSIQTQSLALRVLSKRKPQETQALALASSQSR